jgi:HEAT repeat protein
MRLIHLAPASKERAISKGGLRGAKVTLATSASTHEALAHGVYAMPVVVDFWTTYQWLRELRRWHDETLVAVYFRVADDEPVYAGRYNEPHVARSAAAAAGWVSKNPAGAQVVVPRSVGAKDIVRIKRMPQLVGWTEIPEQNKKLACVCPACLSHGDRNLMRRVRSAFDAGLTAARLATSVEGKLAALRSLDIPLERARGRLAHTKLARFARSPHAQVRRTAARLLGYYGFAKVEADLRRLLGDSDPEVRQESVESMARAGGAQRVSELIFDSGGDVCVSFVELLEYEQDDRKTHRLLERFATHADAEVRSAARRVALARAADT